MNATHLHLLITHLPIFGSIFGGLVLAHGIRTSSNQTKIAAYYLFVLSSVGAVVAYLTGESAEESVENLQGVLEANIKAHETFALYALVGLIALGVSAIVGLIVTFRQSVYTRTVSFMILVLSLSSFVLVARTGYLGGQIRHTELHPVPYDVTSRLGVDDY
jgi:uncharacterized membrane protein